MKTLQRYKDLLNGREYEMEISKEEEEMLKEDGVVMVRGYSDDVIVLAGAIDDEAYPDDNNEIHFDFDKKDVFTRECEEDSCPHEETKLKASKSMYAEFTENGWEIGKESNDIEFLKGDIMEDGEKFGEFVLFKI